jgi:uncharacterized protein YigE (DUF2233 family)
LRSFDIAVTGTPGFKKQTLSAVASAFTSRGSKPILVTNAGIYGTDNQPLGLLISPSGRVRDVNTEGGRGNFFWDSAVFQILEDNTASILPAQNWRDDSHIVAATQSGPQLIAGGKVNPSFPAQSTSTYRRTAIGIDQADRRVIHIVVSREGVTLFELASFMRDAVHCSEALHLDGDLSAFYLPTYIPTLPGDYVFSDPGERIVTALIIRERVASTIPRTRH